MGSSSPPKSQDKEMACGQSSPNSDNSHNPSSSNGVSPLPPPAAAPTPTPSPRLLHRSDPPPSSNGATTFVQADTSSFKQVVQMLTGTSDPAAAAAAAAGHEQGKVTIGAKKPAFKLYERRSSLKSIKLIPLLPAGLRDGGSVVSPRQPQPEILSPSILNFPALVLSPVTPLTHDPFSRPPLSSPALAVDPAAAEERAIAEKGFYLHPSPTTTSEPRLLPLFPVTSPKVSSTSTS